MIGEKEILDDQELLSKVDRSGMLAVVTSLPEMLAQAINLATPVTLNRVGAIKQIVVIGMGGSAIAGDLIKDLYRKKLKIPLHTCRNYFLPEFVGPETLVAALSYSGETEETLSAVQEAEKRGASIFCITSGGKLKELATRKKYPLFFIPAGYQPRAALPFLLVPLVLALEKLGLLASAHSDLQEALLIMQKLRDEYCLARPARTNIAKVTAKKISNKIPVILGAEGTTGAVALRFKNQFNENSKTVAQASVFPEMNHNEIVSFCSLKRESAPFALIVLRDEADSERLKKRIEITKSLISRQLGGMSEVVAQGKSPLAKALSLIIFGDFLSVYLAILKGIDPTPVEAITLLKKELAR